jgi:putative oxidoreductase
MKFLRSLFMFLARLCLATVFLWGGVSKWLYYDQTVQYMASKGFTLIPLFLTGASIIEVLGALSLIFGYKTRFGAAILALFLIPTTAIFHNFWAAAGADQTAQMTHFLGNLAIFGGLLYVVCNGAGWFACDTCVRHPKAEEPKTPEAPKS